MRWGSEEDGDEEGNDKKPREALSTATASAAAAPDGTPRVGL